MLTEAQIEIVDEAGVVEDRVRIVGNGEVALATGGAAPLQLTSGHAPDADLVIALHQGVVTVEAKRSNVLRIGDDFLPPAKPHDVPGALYALIAAVGRRGPHHLHVKTVVTTSSSLINSGGVVIRDEPSELERQAAASIEKGIIKVQEHLARLRSRGVIDEQGRPLVPLPPDMRPDSETDV